MRYLPTNLIRVALAASGLAFGLSACTPTQESAALGAADAAAPIVCPLLPGSTAAKCTVGAAAGAALGSIALAAQNAAAVPAAAVNTVATK
jgi:hypothetical protein